MRYFVPALAILLMAPALAGAEPLTPASEREAWNQPVPEWWQGPIRYALTDEETREYRSLATAAERAAFIARFWAARDPSPFTPANEAEAIFWERVASADELYTDSTIAGWRTDRGRVYVVLGPPDEISSYPLPSAVELDRTHFPDQYQRWPQGELRPGMRGAVEWIYRSLKSSRADAGQKVTFIRDESGEYRLSGALASTFRFEPTYGSRGMQVLNQIIKEQASRGAKSAGNKFAQAEAGQPAGGPVRNDPDAWKKGLTEGVANIQGGMSSIEDMFGFGQAALFEKIETPTEPAARVTTSEFFGVVPIQNRIDFFQGKDGTSALITLGIPSADLKEEGRGRLEPVIFGRLENLTDPSHVYQFSTAPRTSGTVPLQEVGGREHHLYEVRGVLAPGEYRLNFGVRIGDRFGAVGDRVEVPDFGGDALRLAGPVLAEKIGERAPDEGREGFTLGRLRLLPKLEPIFRPESEFGFYFQVYHAVPAPGDGLLHLDIEYSVSARQKGLFVPLGKPVALSDNPAPAHAFIIPLKGWSNGEYLLTVTVTDRSTGQVQAAGASFLVQ